MIKKGISGFLGDTGYSMREAWSLLSALGIFDISEDFRIHYKE